jgi:hypothetical protein
MNENLEVMGCSFTAKGGTVFAWDPTNPETYIEVILPITGNLDAAAQSLTADALDGKLIAPIPGADLNEFIADILAQAVDETSKVLLFPSLRPDPPPRAA